MGQTKIFQILDEATELSQKIKDYKEVADQDMVVIWLNNALELLMKMGKAVEELEDRFELMEDSLKG
jgi:hypothetical protein